MELYKILAQANPSITTLTDVYTVPAGKSAVISCVSIANRSASARTYRLSVAPSGAADSLEQYVAYDASLSGNNTVVFTIGITLGATDVVRAYVSAADLSVNVFGTEIS